MRSQQSPGEASRRRAEEQFKTTKKANPKAPKADDPARQAEAAKTARLRAVRLAKEAADKETASGDAAAAKARRSEPRRRSRTSGLNPVRTQVRLSGISVHLSDTYAASSAKHGELLRDATNRFVQVSSRS
jgi:hypothetical protein